MEDSKKEYEGQLTKSLYNALSYMIIGCAIEVHKILGPGLLESVYQKCLAEEMRQQGIPFLSEFKVPIVYKGIVIDSELRLDFLVNDLILVETKAVEKMNPLYMAQVMTYLKLTNKMRGLLINFNCQNISKEVVSIVTPPYALLPD